MGNLAFSDIFNQLLTSNLLKHAKEKKSGELTDNTVGILTTDIADCCIYKCVILVMLFWSYNGFGWILVFT